MDERKKPELVDGPKGGKLYQGGVPGNKGGGRMPAHIRATARELLDDGLLERVAKIAKGEKIQTSVNSNHGVKHAAKHPTPQVQLQAASLLASLAVSNKYEVLIDDFTAIKESLKIALKYIPRQHWSEFEREMGKALERLVDSKIAEG